MNDQGARTFNIDLEKSPQNIYARSLKVAGEGGPIGDYFVTFVGNEGFVFFKNLKNPIDLPEKNGSGWKIHLTVDPAQINKAADILFEVCEKARVDYFKIARPEMLRGFSDPGEAQRGKFITLYDEGEKWSSILPEIEQKFRAAGIRPGPEVQGDRKIPGSVYMSKRTDKWPGHSEEISAAEVARMRKLNPGIDPSNPFGLKDPLAHVRLEPNPHHRAIELPHARLPVVAERKR